MRTISFHKGERVSKKVVIRKVDDLLQGFSVGRVSLRVLLSIELSHSGVSFNGMRRVVSLYLYWVISFDISSPFLSHASTE
jgi:hypothetical protein